ncbi:MAG: cytochrome P450, partial [Marmoricola sp.]
MEKMSERLTKASAAGHRAVDRSELPPGPRWPALLQSIGIMRFRHQFVPWALKKYGEPFTVSVVPENRSIVFFHNPDAVKEIFAGDPEIFHAGKGNAILGPVMGEHSLLLVDSSQHKRARRMLMPAFNASAIKGYRSLVDDLSEREVASWSPGVAIHTLERMNALTLEVILQVVFGVTDERRLAELRPLVNNTVNVSPAVFLGYGVKRLRTIGPWKRAVANQVELDRVIYAEIAERRRAGDLTERTDVLSRLLCVRDDDHA